MLSHIFYFFGLIIFILTINRIFEYFKFIETKEWIAAFKKVTKRYPLKSDFRNLNDHKLFISLSYLSVVETIWIILGLLTPNWIIFLLLFLLGFLVKQILEFSPFTIQKIVGLFFTIIKSLTIIVLVLNHFHFHENLVSTFLIWI